jgi:hypothetical protein
MMTTATDLTSMCPGCHDEAWFGRARLAVTSFTSVGRIVGRSEAEQGTAASPERGFRRQREQRRA